MNGIDYNEVIISGNINIIKDINENDKYVKFSIVSKKYSINANSKVYISLNISRELYYENLDYFFINSKVYIKGYLNSYCVNNRMQNFITVTSISDNLDSIMYGKKAPHIRYDTDGVMVWNGKRCESKETTEEERKELEDILKEFRGDEENGLSL